MALNVETTSLVLDVYDHDHKQQTTIKAIALDSKTRYVTATITNKGTYYSIDSTATVTLTVIRTDNTGVQITGTPYEHRVNTDGAEVTLYGVRAELSQAALAKKGMLLAQFKMTLGEQILRTEVFKINNGVALDAETSTWADQYEGYNLDDLVETVNAATANVTAMQGNISALQSELQTAEGRIDAIEHGGGSGGGVPSVVRQALLTLLKSTVYGDTGLTDEMAVIESWVSDIDLTSISAVYSGDSVRAGASLNVIKNDLTVTAAYSDGSSATVTDYTLSGTLTEGTSTITVSYGGKTTTFTVNVVSGSTLLNSWDFTESMVDSVGGKVATTTATQDGTGLHFAAGQKYAEFPAVYAKDRTYEIDISSILRSGTALNNYGRLFMIDADSVTGTGGSGYLLTAAKKGGDLFYINGAWESNVIVDSKTDPDGSFYDNSTVGFYIDPSGYVHVYKNGTLVGVSTEALAASYDGANIYFGSSSNQDALQKSTFTAFRVYDGNKYGGEG